MLLLSRICTTSNTIWGISSAIIMWLVFMTIAIGSDVIVLLKNPILDTGETIQIIVGLYVNPLAYIGVVSLVITTVVCLLIGVQVVLYRYVRKARLRATKGHSRGVTSSTFISSVFVALGTGCAACGSLVLISVFSALGLGVSITMTSVVANVLMMVALFVLLYANIRLYSQAKNPLVCPI